MRPYLLLALAGLALLATEASAQTAPPPIALFFSCDARAEAAALAFFDEASASASAEARSSDLESAKTAIQRAAALREAALSGQTVEDPYGGAAFWARLATSSSSPRTAELFRRIAKDQFARSHTVAAMRRTSWAAGLSDNARVYAYRIIARDGCGVDADNTAWLKADLRVNGWFTLTEFGKDADQAAFLLVQHADKDRPFQQQVLALLEPLVAQGKTRPASYAYLFDRVAVARQQPQRYGTQGRCAGPGAWEPFELETPENLDQRRAAVGLSTESAYQAVAGKMCG